MINLNQILKKIKKPLLSHSIDIHQVTCDSRNVQPHDLFIAIPGNQNDGTLFIQEAANKGAAAILMPNNTKISRQNLSYVPIYHPNPRLALSEIATILYPKQATHQIAVTGTNGKSSTVDFIRQFWTFNHLFSASIGTLGVINNVNYHYKGPVLTTPDPLILHQLLQNLSEKKVEHIAVEASSHGLSQYRLDGIRIEAAGFTNLTRDHLDYHKTIENYLAAKLRLFDTILLKEGIACINADMDPNILEQILTLLKKRHIETRLIGHKGKFIKLLSVTPTPHGQEFEIQTSKNEKFNLSIPLLGRYQIDNILLALALISKNIDQLSDFLSYLPFLQGVKGRMQKAASLSNGSSIYVDYAHTPDAITRVLQSLRPHTKHELYIIFGAGGDRDKGKRPLMAKAAAQWADHLVITDDNPRTENARLIRQEISSGCETATIIGNREEAIAQTIQKLQPGDILVVAGKGHEQGQIIGTTIHPFDDVEIIQKYASKL